jgi:ZIP family zinc transporter
MGVASIVGLILPALDEGSGSAVLAGSALGVAFLFAARAVIDARYGHPHGHGAAGERHGLASGDSPARARDPEETTAQAADRKRTRNLRDAALVFLVLLVHSLPEGFAIGTAYGADREGLGLFVIVALGLHNVPEGTAAAIPLHAAGASRSRQFWAAVATSAPQPVGALIAFLLVEQIEALLPLSLAFAAGAMLALVAVEMVPKAWARGGRGQATAGALAGTALMLALSAWLGV